MPVDLEKIKKDLDNMPTTGGVFRISPRYGTSKNQPIENKYKLLSWAKSPSEIGELAKRVYEHFSLGKDNKQRVICPKTYGTKNPCGICDFVASATHSEDPTLTKRSADVRQQERYLQLCIDWSHYEREQDPNKKKHLGIYDCSPKIHRQIMQEMVSQSYDFTTWGESALISLVCYNQGIGMPKAVDFKLTLEKMKPQVVVVEPSEWADLIPDLEAASKPPTPAKLLELLSGEENAQEEPTAEEPGEEEPATEQTEPATTQEEAAAPAEPSAPKPPEETAATKPKMSLADLVKAAKAKK